jgi:hypothetical protein
MSRQRTAIGWVFLPLLSLLCIAFFAIDQAGADGPTSGGQPTNEGLSRAADAGTDPTAVGFVVYDGVPVEGASVILLRDQAVVYSTTTSLGAGTVPSFTVTLSDPPVNAVVDELLTFAFEYMGDVNWLTFRVAPGEQTLTGYLSLICGETEITDGFIGSDTTWTPECGPYLIRTNVLVMNGATLTVGAGTTVMFDADKAMSVDGRLLAQGAPNALVSFTAGQGMPWGYLSFYGQSSGCVLEHTLVEYAGSLAVDPNAAVRVDGVDAEFQGLIVRESLADGINIFNDGTAMMDDLLVFDNEGCGICLDSDTVRSEQVYMCMSLESYLSPTTRLPEIMPEAAVAGSISMAPTMRPPSATTISRSIKPVKEAESRRPTAQPPRFPATLSCSTGLTMPITARVAVFILPATC